MSVAREFLLKFRNLFDVNLKQLNVGYYLWFSLKQIKSLALVIEHWPCSIML